MSEATIADEIELLVAGELDDERRRTLLERIDQEPAGWRKLALAFLEEQTLRSAFADPPPASWLTPSKAEPRPSGRFERLRWLAPAVAFALGIGIAVGWQVPARERSLPGVANHLQTSKDELLTPAPALALAPSETSEREQPVDWLARLPPAERDAVERDASEALVWLAKGGSWEMPDYLQNKLARKGIVLIREPAYAPVIADNVVAGFVPLDKVRLEYHGVENFPVH